MRRYGAASVLALTFFVTTLVTLPRHRARVLVAQPIQSTDTWIRGSREHPVSSAAQTPMSIRQTVLSPDCFGPDLNFIAQYRIERAARRRAEIRNWISETLKGTFYRRWIRQEVLHR